MEATVKMIVFYDNTGKVYFSMSTNETPEGLERYVFDIPEGYTIKSINMADPANPKPLIEKKDVPVDYKAELTAIEEAVAEIYEMLIGEEA
jgi:hypothetical protein